MEFLESGNNFSNQTDLLDNTSWNNEIFFHEKINHLLLNMLLYVGHAGAVQYIYLSLVQLWVQILRRTFIGKIGGCLKIIRFNLCYLGNERYFSSIRSIRFIILYLVFQIIFQYQSI